MAESICSELDCERPSRARGLCKSHYYKGRTSGSLTLLPRRLAAPGEPACVVPDCGRPAVCRGLCSGHYGRAWREGTLEAHALPPKVPTAGPGTRVRHALTNVDLGTGTADCSACGLSVRFRVKSNGVPRCRVRRRPRRPAPPPGGRRGQLLRRYKLTVAEYEAMLVAQGGTCAICDKPPRGRAKSLSVDHDHKTGRVRGLLCLTCNSAIGFLRDDANAALRASIYLVQK